jgi:hypothetical protein
MTNDHMERTVAGWLYLDLMNCMVSLSVILKVVILPSNSSIRNSFNIFLYIHKVDFNGVSTNDEIHCFMCPYSAPVEQL